MVHFCRVIIGELLTFPTLYQPSTAGGRISRQVLRNDKAYWQFANASGKVGEIDARGRGIRWTWHQTMTMLCSGVFFGNGIATR
jgi:hypothetical protein